MQASCGQPAPEWYKMMSGPCLLQYPVDARSTGQMAREVDGLIPTGPWETTLNRLRESV